MIVKIFTNAAITKEFIDNENLKKKFIKAKETKNHM